MDDARGALGLAIADWPGCGDAFGYTEREAAWTESRSFLPAESNTLRSISGRNSWARNAKKIVFEERRPTVERQVGHDLSYDTGEFKSWPKINRPQSKPAENPDAHQVQKRCPDCW